MWEKYTAMVIDPDTESRMRLRQATVPLDRFREIILHSDPLEAYQKLQYGSPIDIIFLSHLIDPDKRRDFVTQGKTTKSGQDTAYVLTLKSTPEAGQSIAEDVLSGADGFLVEPYSADSLDGTITLAAKVKKERRRGREIKAFGLMLNDILKQVDRVSFLASQGRDTCRAFEKLRKLCTTLENLQSSSQDVYFECAIDRFMSAPPMSLSDMVRYEGPSNRVKKILVDKAIAKLEGKD